MQSFRRYLILITALMTSCTYSITQVHTQGTASDIIDENQTATPTFTTDVSTI